MKRILAFLVSLSVILTCMSGISLVAFAADLSAIGVSGEGTTASPFIIDTADKFVAVFGADATTTATTHAKGVVIYVTSDIDLPASYVPNTAMFQGKLYGWNSETGTAEKRTINIGDVTRTGVDAYVSTSAKKNVVGGVLNSASTTEISHFIIRGTLTGTATDAVGAFIGYDDTKASKYKYIDNYVTVNGTATQTGGIAGFARSVFDHCSNNADITGSKTTGGIAGAANSSGVSVDYCVNYGNITGCNHVGGIIGAGYQSFKKCANLGDISGKTTAGGIVGYNSENKTVMQDCFNAGTIKFNATGANGGCGGLIGRFYFSSSNSTPSRPMAISNCYNIGAVTGLKKDGLPYCAYGSCVGDVQGTGSMKNSSTQYAQGSIAGYYDLANVGMQLYGVYNNLGGSMVISDAYVIDDADGANTATYATMKALTAKTGSAFADPDVWEVDATANYKFPTLVANPYDDNLPAVEEPEIEEPEEPEVPEETETIFEQYEISGAGTVASPYIIDTAVKFNALFGNSVTDEDTLNKIRDAEYAVTADIDLSGLDFVPNTTMPYFTGGLHGSDGNGNKVQRTINIGTGRTYAGKDGKYAGGIINVIGYGGNVSYLTLEGSFTATATEGTGGLAGTITGGTSNIVIESIINKIDIIGVDTVGGVIGYCALEKATIKNCHNEGDITGSAYPVAGIVGTCVNPKIEGCSNTGRIKNTATSSNGYVGGIIGIYRISKNTDTYLKNCWNAGVIECNRPRNGGIGGILWKHRDATSIGYDVGVEISNCYNVGTFAGSETDRGHIFGYNNTDTTAASGGVDPQLKNKPVISGFYAIDASIPLIANQNSCAKTTGVTYTSNYVYTLNEDLEYANATKVNKTELIGLPTSSDAVFSNSSNWVAGSGSFPYPQIVNNPYTGAAIELPDDPVESAYTVENIEVYYENGAYKIKWDAEAVADSYELHYGDEIATVTLNGDVTSIVKNKEVAIQVYAIKGATSYPSDEVTINGYYGGGTGVENDEYLIYDADHFANVEKNADAYFKQMDNFEVTTPLFIQENKELKYGEAKTWFDGIYDGNNKTITVDFIVNNTGDPAYALFTYIKYGTIKNLSVAGTLHVEKSNEEIMVAGIVGSAMTGANYKILNCKNYVDITSNEETSYVRSGGIMSISYQSSPTGIIKDCVNYGDIEGTHPGGILYRIRNKETVENCANYGNLTGSVAGGIVSYSEGGVIKNSFNFGSVTGSTASGILGSSEARYNNIVISDCFNAGTLSGNYTSGIVRENKLYAGKTLTVTNCYNITAAKYPIAKPLDTSALTVTNCYYVTIDGKEGSVTLDGLKTAALGDAYEIKGNYPYPQLKTVSVDAGKADIEYVKFTYNNDGEASIDKQTSEGYVVKGSEVRFFVETKDADFKAISIKANDVDLAEGITAKREFSYIVNEDTVIYTEGVTIEAPEEISALESVPGPNGETGVIASNGGEAIEVDGKEYSRYALVVGKIPTIPGLKLMEYGVLVNSANDFESASVKTAKAGENKKLNKEGCYGILIYGDTESGIKNNKTYYTKKYAIYQDANGNIVKAFGDVESFVLTAPADAE